jgi:hypothetical protein
MIFEKEILVNGVQTMGSGIFGSFKIPITYSTGITYCNKSKSQKRIVMDIETTFSKV